MNVVVQKPKTMFECIEQVLNIELRENFMGDSLNRNTILTIQHALINRLEELLNQECSLGLDPVAVAYTVKQLMLHITVKTSDGQNMSLKENQQIRDIIEGAFARQVTLENVNRRDLEILAKVLQGATFQNELEVALSRR